MKFLHTADWHLGRIFHQLYLTDDQAAVLAQVVELARAEQVDAVLVAGDLYDRAVPPPEAVALLGRVWQQLALEVGVPVVAIAGNHDSATRLGYGAALLARSGLHMVADFDMALRPIPIGAVDVYALPFAEPAEVRAWSGDATVRDHASAMAVCLARMRPNFRPGRPRVLVAHAFVAGAARESESERPLSVGGAGTVEATLFADFAYVALGHLHAPQAVAAHCVYAGSPLKYSFSEADDIKSVTLVEIDAAGAVRYERRPLQPRREVRQRTGLLTDLLAAAPTDPARHDYLRITLTDSGALLNALGRLREVYPHVLQLERSFLHAPLGADGPIAANAGRRRDASEEELLADFFREVTGSPPSAAERACVREVLDDWRRAAAELPSATAR